MEMSLQDLGSVGEFASALGVMISLIYLAFQVRQNTDIQKANTRQAVADSVQRQILCYIENPGLREAIPKNDLDEHDQDLRNAWTRMLFRSWENFFYQYRKGLLDTEEYEAQKEFYRTEVVKPSKQFWAQQRLQHSSRFRAEVDSVMSEIS